MTHRESKGQRADPTITTGDGLKLLLRPYRRNRRASAKRTVLLLHGASASSETFRLPENNSLIDHLRGKGFDVWTLDWRSSCLVVPHHVHDYEKFTLDKAAEEDLPTALAHIRKDLKGRGPIGVFGHCMGAGVLAMAIGGGTVQKSEIDRVVLSTLGLFYEASWDGWVKAEDRILERIRGEDPQCRFIDSDAVTHPWPRAMEDAYHGWPATLLPQKDPQIFRRLAFMFGRPYDHSNTSKRVHNEKQLSSQFGPMPLKLYMHCAQNVRRGFAAPFDNMDWTPARRGARPSGKSVTAVARGYLNAENFRGLKTTLITGGRNQLWHPDSIHRMYDWLRRELGGKNCEKQIFERYAHQDLVWGRKSRKEVYPAITAGLM